jgi:hypothetical protein
MIVPNTYHGQLLLLQFPWRRIEAVKRGKTLRCVSSDCGIPRGSLCIHMIASIGISLGRVCHRDRVFKVPCSRKALSVLQGQRGRLLVHWRESGLILRGEAQAMDPDYWV